MNQIIPQNKVKNKIVLALLALIAAAIVFFSFAIYWVYYLHVAHSTFDNYYKFRGCAQLLQKTDTYGMCELPSGQVIKIVKYHGAWYLDGDLPFPGLNFL
jgi:hypothetical protein